VNSSLATIGITCYNAETTIARAINSALSQSWRNLEIVVVDDCSTDRSVALVENTIAGRPTARLIRHDVNRGPAAARNTILREATGEFVAFFDDDDESLPERVETQIRHLEGYERTVGATLVACVASGIRRYPNGYTQELPAIGSRGHAPQGPGFADYLLYFHRRRDWDYGGGVPARALLARRSTFLAVGAFDSRLRRVEDNDLAIRLALAGAHFTGPAAPLYVQYATTAPDKSPDKNLEAEQAVVRKYRGYLERKGRYYYALHWHKLRYWHFMRRYDRLIIEFLRIFLRHPIVATKHILATGPRRLAHEWRMTRKPAR
jgi:glycosyltransferase involved in cell wall biosynthesis